MKAVIMAAGIGSRLGGVTGGMPKAFLKVGDTTLIEHQISLLVNAGVDEIIIVTGYKKDEFKKFEKEIPQVTLVYNPFYDVVNVLGSFWFAKDHLDQPFLYMHADTYFEEAIFKKVLEAEGNVFAVDFTRHDEEAMKVRLDEGKIVEISKEITNPDGEFIGLAKIDDFESVKRLTSHLIEKYHCTFFEKVVQSKIDEKVVCVTVDVSGLLWEEIDFEEDYHRLVQKLGSEKSL